MFPLVDDYARQSRINLLAYWFKGVESLCFRIALCHLLPGRTRLSGSAAYRLRFNVVDENGTLVATIRGMRSTATGRREQQRLDKNGDRVRQQVLTYDWMYSETVGEPKRLGHWLVVGGRDSVTDFVAEQLQNFGAIVAV